MNGCYRDAWILAESPRPSLTGWNRHLIPKRKGYCMSSHRFSKREFISATGLGLGLGLEMVCSPTSVLGQQPQEKQGVKATDTYPPSLRSCLLCAHGGKGPRPLWFGAESCAGRLREAGGGSVSPTLGHVDWCVRTSLPCGPRPIPLPLDTASRISRLVPEEADQQRTSSRSKCVRASREVPQSSFAQSSTTASTHRARSKA